jgi:hypothetical protein
MWGKKDMNSEGKTNICGSKKNTKDNKNTLSARKKIINRYRMIREEQKKKEPSKHTVVLFRTLGFTEATLSSHGLASNTES